MVRIVHLQSEGCVRHCAHVCIRGMLLVQKGNWNFPVAELVGTIVCVERKAGFYYCECEKLKWQGTLSKLGLEFLLCPGQVAGGGWSCLPSVCRGVQYSCDSQWKLKNK